MARTEKCTKIDEKSNKEDFIAEGRQLTIHEEALIKVLLEKGIKKEIMNKSKLITPEIMFNFVEIDVDRSSVFFNLKEA